MSVGLLLDRFLATVIFFGENFPPQKGVRAYLFILPGGSFASTLWLSVDPVLCTLPACCWLLQLELFLWIILAAADVCGAKNIFKLTTRFKWNHINKEHFKGYRKHYWRIFSVPRFFSCNYFEIKIFPWVKSLGRLVEPSP